jgi:stage V sporulation protein D (sporulation-specific penicillin-binding protein)
VGADAFYDGMNQLGLLSKTNIDIPGEAGTLMHKKEAIGLVELATVSFGQSFQVTPMQMAATVSSIINGGIRVTPHFAKEIRNEKGALVKRFSYENNQRIISEEISEMMRTLLESVVAEGGGSKGKVEGYRIGGKTATSQTLPRSAKQYISSFVGFAPADDPQVLGLVIIAKPTGIYYGGTIAAPVLQNIFENILPYLEIETVETSE